MASIKITELRPAGFDLFQDSESFLNELGDREMLVSGSGPVASVISQAMQKGDESPKSRIAAIVQHFALLGIELQRPYLNANSEDIYTLLDCSDPSLDLNGVQGWNPCTPFTINL